MEKLKELRECMDKLKERTKELNDKHNKDIDSFINLQSNYDTFEEFYENEDVGDWTVEDITNEYILLDVKQLFVQHLIYAGKNCTLENFFHHCRKNVLY